MASERNKIAPSPPPTARLALRLLGDTQFFLHGEPIKTLTSSKAVALLAYLAIESDRSHRREWLARIFWPDSAPGRMGQNLRKTLSRLRRDLGDNDTHCPRLIVTPHTARFNLAPDVWLDTEHFSAALKEAQAHPHRRLTACPPCMEKVAAAAQLYRGDFLADIIVPESLTFHEWLLVEQERWRREAAWAFRALASYSLARGNDNEAEAWARRLLAQDRWDEGALRLLLQALARRASRTTALAHFKVFREALAAELDVPPEDATLDLVAQIRAGKLPPPADQITPRLPLPATPFIGREAEVAQVTRYLAERDVRLVSLVGPGGSGKTRLALQVAADQTFAWRDGVWFASLAGAAPDIPLEEILSRALEIPQTRGKERREQLLTHLRDKELLLVLDNFEHLRDSAPLLAEILRWSPAVKILVTSRSRLGLRAEVAMPLSGLAYPRGEAGGSQEEFDAVQLFCQSARRARPTFTPTKASRASVARICKLVAGLPLAIELAAALIHYQAPSQIAAEIERDLDVLERSEGPDTAARHTSLRATFDYSYRLLSPGERAIFRRLSVFRQGFGPDAAESVAGATPANLTALWHASLLQKRGRNRWDIHPTLQPYAAQELAAYPGEEQETRDRHSEFYLALLRDKGPDLVQDDARGALAELSTERDNLRRAWEWAAARGNLAAIEASRRGLLDFYMMSGDYQEGARVFGRAAETLLALSPLPGGASATASRLLVERADFLLRQGLPMQVKETAEQAIALAESTPAPVARARGTMFLGAAAWNAGDYKTARTQLERAFSLLRDIEPAKLPEASARDAERAEGVCLNLLAGVCWSQGNLEGARAYLEQMLAIFARTGYRTGEISALGNLGVIASEQGDYAAAKSYYKRALRFEQEAGRRNGAPYTNLGELCLAVGAYTEARSYLERALAINEEIGARRNVAWGHGYLGLLAYYLGEHEEALNHSRQALRIAQAIGDRAVEGMAWMKVGLALEGAGQREGATEAYQEAVAVQRALGQNHLVVEPLAGLARVALARGIPAQAQTHVEEILRLSDGGDNLHGMTDPYQISLTCYRVLRRNDDPRADDLLLRAYRRLQDQAERIEDVALQRSFLHKVASHRKLVQAYQALDA